MAMFILIAYDISFSVYHNLVANFFKNKPSPLMTDSGKQSQRKNSTNYDCHRNKFYNFKHKYKTK